MKKYFPFSKIIAGTMTWGTWGKNFKPQEMANLIHSYIDLGITSFDHADIYGGYSTEGAFGKAISESRIERSQMQLITKCGIQMVDEARDNVVKHYNLSLIHI